MPTYSFICDNCGAVDELTMPMREAGEDIMCAICKAEMRRDFQADLPLRSPSGKDYRRPIISDSLAVMPHQIAEHRKEFPDIQVTPTGQPVFDNYTDHEAYLKKTGFRKARQKIKRKPTSSGK